MHSLHIQFLIFIPLDLHNMNSCPTAPIYELAAKLLSDNVWMDGSKGHIQRQLWHQFPTLSSSVKCQHCLRIENRHRVCKMSCPWEEEGCFHMKQETQSQDSADDTWICWHYFIQNTFLKLQVPCLLNVCVWFRYTVEDHRNTSTNLLHGSLQEQDKNTFFWLWL